MDYAELTLPAALDGLVAAVWTARVTGDAWVDLEAVPDGCVELIRRHSGQSIWRREQPALFATGLATTTAKLRLGPGASFIGIKLWPWAWHALGGAPCPGFADDWIPVEDPALAALVEDGTIERLVDAFATARISPIGEAVLGARGVAEIAARAGLSHRQLQRRFASEFGMPPRGYLRLLRFKEALASVQSGEAQLADTAAEMGYADQAHMARAFRDLTGLPPSKVRTRARGPFV